MPPRPDPLEEPDFSTDAEVSESRFWSKKKWNKIAGTRSYEAIGRAFANLRPYQRDETWPIMGFLIGSHDIAHNGNEHLEWIADRCIFQWNSTVGLWIKQDATQKRVDEIIIKDIKNMEIVTFVDVPEAKHDLGIVEEAVFQVDIQRKERQELSDQTIRSKELHILHLRQYKWNPECQSLRFYQTFGPSGTVLDLDTKYRLLGHAPPEAFYFHLLNSLARACITLEGPLPETAFYYKTTPSGKKIARKPDDYMIHHDIKHLNVILDYPPVEDDELEHIYDGTATPECYRSMYPVVKLTDFGLLAYMNPADMPRSLRISQNWRPPQLDRWGHNFEPPPNVYPVQHDSKFEVWGIAKIVHDAVFHSSDETAVPRQLKLNDRERGSVEEMFYQERDYHFMIKDTAVDYSETLRDLLYECLSPRLQDRPTLQQLWERTQKWLEDWDTNLRSSHPLSENIKQHRLYFRNNEINELGARPAVQVRYSEYLRARYSNPEHPLAVASRWQPSGDPQQRKEGELRKLADYHVQHLANGVRFGDGVSDGPLDDTEDGDEEDGAGRPKQPGKDKQPEKPKKPEKDNNGSDQDDQTPPSQKNPPGGASKRLPGASFFGPNGAQANDHADMDEQGQQGNGDEDDNDQDRAPSGQTQSKPPAAPQPSDASSSSSSSSSDSNARRTKYDNWNRTDLRREIKEVRKMPNPTAGKGVTNASLAQLLVDDDRRQRKEKKKGAVIGGGVSKKKRAAKGGATGNKASKGGGNAKSKSGKGGAGGKKKGKGRK